MIIIFKNLKIWRIKTMINSKKGLLTIGDLSKFSRVPRTTLDYYDKEGVLKPVYVDDNKYRYYAFYQIGWLNLIRTMQVLGLSLKEIMQISEHRTPETMLELFSQQANDLNSIIRNYTEARKLMLTLQTTIEHFIAIDENKIELIEEPESHIFLGQQNDYNDDRMDWDAIVDFYHYCEQNKAGISLNYSAWGMFSEERIKKGDWKYPDKYYLNFPDGKDTKPAGWYVVGYGRGYYGQTDEIYKRIIAYIDENDIEICGPAYESYPLNEISIQDPNNYLIRISITARKNGIVHIR